VLTSKLDLKHKATRTCNQKFSLFKSLHLESISTRTCTPIVNKNLVGIGKFKTLKLFNIFLNTSTRSLKSMYKVHPSAKIFFVSYTKLGTAIFSLTRLYAKWQDFYSLVYNINFYRLPLITLGTRLFKDELLSLN